MNRVLILWSTFSASLEMIIYFLLYSVNVVNYNDWFSKCELTFHSWHKSHLVMMHSFSCIWLGLNLFRSLGSILISFLSHGFNLHIVKLIIIRESILEYDIHPLKFLKTCFTAQFTVYSGNYFMSTWKENIFCNYKLQSSMDVS